MFMYESVVVVVVHNTNQHCLKVARTAADAAAVLFILRICFNLFRNANRATKHLRSFSHTHTSTRTLSHTLFHTHTSQSQCLLARFYGSLSLISLWASTLALLCRIISVVVVISVPLQRTLAHYYYNNYILSILVFSLLLWFIFSGAQKHNKFQSNKMKIINKILLGIGGGEGKGSGWQLEDLFGTCFVEDSSQICFAELTTQKCARAVCVNCRLCIFHSLLLLL